MSNAKYIIVILVLLIVVSAFVALSTLSQKTALEQERDNIKSQLTKAEETASKLAGERKKLDSQLKEAKSKESALTKELNTVKNQVDSLIVERNSWEDRIKALRVERDELMAKLQEKPEPQIIYKYKEVPSEAAPAHHVPSEEVDEGYWAGILKEKVSLELDLEELHSEISSYVIKIEELKKKNSDLDLEVSALQEEKEDIVRRIKYGEDLANALSIELAREKNDKRYVAERYDKTKEENISLRSRVKELTTGKINLEKSIVRLTEDKQNIQRRLLETESVIQNRIDEILDIKRGLDRRIGVPVDDNESFKESSREVELPPIIVSAPSPRSEVQLGGGGLAPGFNGQVVNIDNENNFVIVDIGEDSGIQVGERLSVYRGAEYIAGLEIIQTRKDISAADIKQKGANIKVGDTVR